MMEVNVQAVKETLEYIRGNPRYTRVRWFFGKHKSIHDQEIFDKVSFIVRHDAESAKTGGWLDKLIVNIDIYPEYNSIQEIDQQYAFIRDKETVRYFLENPARREARYIFKRYKLSHNRELFKALHRLKREGKLNDTIQTLNVAQTDSITYITHIREIIKAYQESLPKNEFVKPANLNYQKIEDTIQYIYENHSRATLRHIYDVYKSKHDEGLFRYLVLLSRTGHYDEVCRLQAIFSGSEEPAKQLEQLIERIKYYFDQINRLDIDVGWKKLFKKSLNLFFDRNKLPFRLIRPRTLKEKLYLLSDNEKIKELTQLANSNQEYIFIEDEFIINFLFNRYEIERRRENKAVTTYISYVPTVSVAAGEGLVAGGLTLQAGAKLWMVISTLIGGALTNYYLLKDDNREVFLEATVRDKIFKDANGKSLSPFKKIIISLLIFWTITSGAAFGFLSYTEALILFKALLSIHLASSIALFLAVNTFITLTTLIYFGLVIEIKNFGLTRIENWFKETFMRREGEHLAACIVRGTLTAFFMLVMAAISLITLAVTAIFLGEKSVVFFKECIKLSPKITYHLGRALKGIMWAAAAAFDYLASRKLQNGANFAAQKVGEATEAVINKVNEKVNKSNKRVEAEPLKPNAPKKGGFFKWYLDKKINPYRRADRIHSTSIRAFFLPALAGNTYGQYNGPAKMINEAAGILFGFQSAIINAYNGSRATESLDNEKIAAIPSYESKEIQSSSTSTDEQKLSALKNYTAFFLAVLDSYTTKGIFRNRFQDPSRRETYETVKTQLEKIDVSQKTNKPEEYSKNAKEIIEKTKTAITKFGLFGEKGSGTVELLNRYKQNLPK